jgi:hypothetical protein
MAENVSKTNDQKVFLHGETNENTTEMRPCLLTPRDLVVIG